MSDEDKSAAKPAEPERKKTLPPAALRALEEAEARRATYEEAIAKLPPERGGRGGKDPVRYGDWEVKGVATDF